MSTQNGHRFCDQCFDPITVGGRVLDGEDWCDDCLADRPVLPRNVAIEYPFEGSPVFVRDPIIGVLARAGIKLYDTHDPEEKAVPPWAAQAASACLSVVWFASADQMVRAIRKVETLPELQQALVSGRSVGASGMDLFWMIEEWEAKKGGFQ